MASLCSLDPPPPPPPPPPSAPVAVVGEGDVRGGTVLTSSNNRASPQRPIEHTCTVLIIGTVNGTNIIHETYKA